MSPSASAEDPVDPGLPQAAAAPPARFCPSCGRAVADATYCPEDGTATVRRHPVDAAALEPAVGDVLDGRYRIVGRLGRGGFGAVFRARHTGTGQEVAVKLLMVDLATDNLPQVRRFWQEAQTTARLRSDHTVRVFDVGQSERGAFYLAMELLHGQTLAQRLEALEAAGQRMGEEEARTIAAQVCASLAEAHDAGLVHRDLKPPNIMLLDDPDRPGRWRVKVLDFGIARRADSSLTGGGAILGTPAYMSPEQCRGDGLDGRSDLYALGAIVYRCLAGRPPFVDANPLTVLFQHAVAPLPALAPLCLAPPSAACEAIVGRALAKEATARFADARAMRAALEGRDGADVAALPSVPDERTVTVEPAQRPTIALAPIAAAAPAVAGASDDATDATWRDAAVPAPAPPGRRRMFALGLVGGVALAAATAWWLRPAPTAPTAAAATAPSGGAEAAGVSSVLAPAAVTASAARGSDGDAAGPAAGSAPQGASASGAAADVAPAGALGASEGDETGETPLDRRRAAAPRTERRRGAVAAPAAAAREPAAVDPAASPPRPRLPASAPQPAQPQPSPPVVVPPPAPRPEPPPAAKPARPPAEQVVPLD